MREYKICLDSTEQIQKLIRHKHVFLRKKTESPKHVIKRNIIILSPYLIKQNISEYILILLES